MKKTLIAIDEPLQRFATNRRPIDLSRAVNLAIDRYQNILAESVPDFSRRNGS